jgi:hypothetical protein
MKTVAALSLAGLLGAQAFVAPAPKFGRTRGVAKMSFENEAGVTAPLGYWVGDCPWVHLCLCVMYVCGRALPLRHLPACPPPRRVGCAGSIALPGVLNPHIDLYAHTHTPIPPPPSPPQDPLGFSADGDVEKFNRYRAIEIKHGRGT